MGDMRKCNKLDCYAIDKELRVCTLLRPTTRDKPTCSFYCSDPDGDVKKKIMEDIRNYYYNLGGYKK